MLDRFFFLRKTLLKLRVLQKQTDSVNHESRRESR